MTYKPYDRKNRKSYDQRGLVYLYWELFDSPDAPGSAFRYMEREPVLILDDIMREHRDWKPQIEVAYTTKTYADILGLPTSSSHRVGCAVQLRARNPEKRMFIVSNLIRRGVTRIGVGIDHVYFDTDNYLKKDALYVQK